MKREPDLDPLPVLAPQPIGLDVPETMRRGGGNGRSCIARSRRADGRPG
jgi:hypothetical protein